MIKVTSSGKDFESLDFSEIDQRGLEVADKIDNRTGAGNDFLGWTNYTSKLPESEVKRIIATAQRIRENYDCLVVVGIGGSYLGARAAIEAINGLYSKDNFEIIFLGNTLSSTYTKQVLDYLENKKFAVNVISKSGTTTEPAVAFRLLKNLIIRKRGFAAVKDAVIATTDAHKGALKTEANAEGYDTFVILDDVGGRYSVITPVGLLPIACAGIDIKEFIKGVVDGEKEYSVKNYKDNPAYMYGATRYLLYKKGIPSEMYVSYEPQFAMIAEWLKQLFGESEGKEGVALLPTSATFTTDLHSMGQFIQEGSNVLFETILKPEHAQEDVEVESDSEDLDGLNYLAGKKLSYINDKAFEGTKEAHEKTGGKSVNIISFDKMDEYNLGNLFYFFMRACAYSAYLLDVNPFNQPGVEVYKKNMFTLLGKPIKK